MKKIASNVQASGTVACEIPYNKNFTQLKISLGSSATTTALIDKKIWKSFKYEFPNQSSITVDGRLFNTYSFIVDGGVRCFHNLLSLSESIDESKFIFQGKVKLLKKFEFNSNLYIKRMIFETEDHNTFSAIALRNITQYFDDINIGDEIILSAIYVNDGVNTPYWKINHIPEQVVSK